MRLSHKGKPFFVNESEFTALPGGTRGPGSFIYLHAWSFKWSSTSISSVSASYYRLDYNNPYINNFNQSMYYGKSVRCLKD